MSTVIKHAASAVRTVFLHTGCFRTIDTHTLLKVRLSARSRVRTYATTSATRKGNISPTLCFFRPALTPLLADLVQDLYLKELRTYKVPPAVRSSIHPSLSPATLTHGRRDRPKMLMLAP